MLSLTVILDVCAVQSNSFSRYRENQRRCSSEACLLLNLPIFPCQVFCWQHAEIVLGNHRWFQTICVRVAALLVVIQAAHIDENAYSWSKTLLKSWFQTFRQRFEGAVVEGSNCGRAILLLGLRVRFLHDTCRSHGNYQRGFILKHTAMTAHTYQLWCSNLNSQGAHNYSRNIWSNFCQHFGFYKAGIAATPTFCTQPENPFDPCKCDQIQLTSVVCEFVLFPIQSEHPAYPPQPPVQHPRGDNHMTCETFCDDVQSKQYTMFLLQ